MDDMRVHLEKLRTDAAECEMISQLSTDKMKRELFSRLAEHMRILAGEVERAIQDQTAEKPALKH